MPEDWAAPAGEMRGLLYGFLVARVVCAMAELGLADHLAGGPLTAESLASRTAVEPSALYRVLRCAAAYGVLVQDAEGAFALTPLGETLRSDVPGSARPTALLISAAVGAAWNGLTDSVKTAAPAFPRVFARDFYSYLDERPGLRDIFDQSQEAGLALVVKDVVAELDFPVPCLVADIGGGDGAFIVELLKAFPGLRGILADRSASIAHAARRMAESGVGDRVRLWSGDIFAELPAGADCYLIRHVLHNLSDDHCVALLRACHEVMRDDARLKVVDFVLDGRLSAGALRSVALMDLYMMCLFDGGKERDLPQLGALLGEAGFDVAGVSRIPSGVVIIDAVKST